MPTYEYKCSACDTRFERFHSITAAPVKKCPNCGRNKVVRLISTGAGLIFKGSGFYITDYRSDGYKEAARKESGDTKTPASGSAGGDAAVSKASKPAEPKPAESKPAAKSESKGSSKKTDT